ncbi:hypothetical protein D3C73_1227580 [compost metagenome]
MKLFSHFGAISAQSTAIPTEIGTAITSVNAVSDNVFTIKAAAPKASSSGVQLKDRKKSAGETCANRSSAVFPMNTITSPSTKQSARMLNKKYMPVILLPSRCLLCRLSFMMLCSAFFGGFDARLWTGAPILSLL